MATPYTKLDGVNYKIQAGLPAGGVDTIQFTDSASSFTQTVPAATGTFALTTIATGANAIVTTDMAAAFRALDGLVMPNVLGYLTNTPPGSPAMGDTYIIGAAPTGAWVGQGGKVTRYSSTLAAWEFYTPKNGWMLQANSARESYRYTGSAWEIFYQEGTWTPVLSPTSGSITTQSNAGSFIKVGKQVVLFGELSIPNNGTGSGALSCSGMPFTVGSYPSCGASRERNVGGLTATLQTLAGATTFNIYRYDNAYPGVNGAIFPFSLAYSI